MKNPITFLAVCVLVMSGCKSGTSGENAGIDSTAAQPQIETTEQLRQLGVMSKGWRLQGLRFVNPIPADMQAIVSQASEEMLLVHRLWLKRDYSYQQEVPQMNGNGPANVVRQTGRWQFDEANRLIYLNNEDGSPYDTLTVRHLDRDSMVTESGAASEREIRVYVPF